jgi:DNA-binding response OmpR family regulator
VSVPVGDTIARLDRWPMRLLVAEDDAGLRSVLARGLQEAGYVVDAVPDGDEALSYLRTYEYEVAVLDWRMPRKSGIEVIRALRHDGSGLPVLLLTSRDAAADRVMGLDEGADDYLVKPFDFAELLARIRALQRRSPSLQGPQLSVADVRVDPATREVLVGTRSVSLTGTEFSILEILARRSPAVVERRSIAVQVWAEESDALGSNTIDVHVARLRSKLAGASAHIETLRGVGYRIVPK